MNTGISGNGIKKWKTVMKKIKEEWERKIKSRPEMITTIDFIENFNIDWLLFLKRTQAFSHFEL